MKHNTTDIKIFTITFILIGISIAFMYGASAKVTERLDLNQSYFFNRQLIYGIISLFIMLISTRINIYALLKLTPIILLFSIATLTLVLIPSIGTEISGARRWINFKIFYFQPSELAKLAIILFIAKQISSKQEKLNNLKKLAPSIIVIILFSTLIFIGKDLSSSFLILLVSLNLIFIGGAPIRYFLYILLTVPPLLYFLITSVSHMKARLLKYLKKFIDDSYSPLQEKLAAKSITKAGLLGKGFGLGSYNNSIPEAHTDFYFASLISDIGFIGGCVILFLYSYLYYLCFKLASQTNEKSFSFIIYGITLMLIYQTLFNLSSVLGILPITGITLPFLSFGGNSLIISSLFIGIMLGIAKTENKKK